MSKYLHDICFILDTYGGRDKVMKGLSYTAKVLSGFEKNRNVEYSKKFATFSSAISNARATLRLVDDLPLLQRTLKYGFGSKEPDTAIAILGVLINLVDMIYYIADKICWLSEYKLLTLDDPNRWDTINKVFWVSSIHLNLIKNLRAYILQESSSNVSRPRTDLLTIFRITTDFVLAASTLPKGWLWGGRFEPWQIGVLGIVSAFIGIYQSLPEKHVETKKQE